MVAFSVQSASARWRINICPARGGEHMRTAKENGAVAVHIAHSNPASCELWRHFPGTQRTNGCALWRAPTVIACDMLMMSDLPQRLWWGLQGGPRRFRRCHRSSENGAGIALQNQHAPPLDAIEGKV